MSIETNPASATETFEKFVVAINSHNIEALIRLMTTDHLFVDSLGNRVQGAASMKTGWRAYFAMCPDYAIVVRKTLANSDTVMSTGVAGGTIDNVAWQTPAAWLATINNGQVAEWRVFADNKPVYDILALRPRKQS
ncbi:nuclear transport factor 2 family protein [Tunturibacter empetritectus]|uniref:Ketosteroid isomerase-like protein n=1 Tax=Tunturiibacter empetritectus TaxID=3069691 RepID=A0A7W8IJL6_9BACT|nr:nuclear transport factor 2 family protein [Edaphobacter lichenicola]MBB5317580.1 ketosteroid isomerase-like protein [Edaphobacter lichenicola]